MNNFIEKNHAIWNSSTGPLVKYTIPISHEKFLEQKTLPINVALTIGKTVPLEWFEKTNGKKLLGLACGGGQQGPVFASHGYQVTIMDFSERQLEADRMVAKREGLQIETIQADMTRTFPFADESFDIIFCPVSNVYIDDLTTMWQESYRVLRKGGLLMVGYMNPWCYMFDSDSVWDRPDEPLLPVYSLPYDSKKLEKEGKITLNEGTAYEFSHTLEEQIRGQLQAGFAMIDFYESKNLENRLTEYSSDYLANLSIKF